VAAANCNAVWLWYPTRRAGGQICLLADIAKRTRMYLRMQGKNNKSHSEIESCFKNGERKLWALNSAWDVR